MREQTNKTGIAKFCGMLLLLSVVGWMAYLQFPVLSEGYLNAGDDHVHVAFANEVVRVWKAEGRVLGWNGLYGAGTPIFLMRPPGFYVAVAAVHILTGITVEQALKIVVFLGLSLFPLTVFWGGRLLGLGFGASLAAGVLSLLPVSLWGHTIDAYHYLGIHKQLIAIALFPVAAGSLWSLLREGKHGALYAGTFAVIFITHPYIAYCFVFLIPCALVALASMEESWKWKQTLGRGALCSLVAALLISAWLVPFVSSPEIQAMDPYQSRRTAFEVTVCSTTETLRQFVLGGVLDTTRFAGPFGGANWIPGNEWGWRDNGKVFRFPILTVLSFIGWAMVFRRPKRSIHGFLSLSLLAAMLLFIGPDDFPFLDMIPFAGQFQNVHAVFMVEWAAIMLAGVAVSRLYEEVISIQHTYRRYAFTAILTILLAGACATAFHERTEVARNTIRVRNVVTENGNYAVRPGMNEEWRHFGSVVEALKKETAGGAIGTLPQAHEDSVLYNLLPLMVGRTVFICGFENAGGVYDLILGEFRSEMRDNYNFQKLFNVRYALNSPFHRKEEMDWHGNTHILFRDDYWELVRIEGTFGDFDALPRTLVGFVGSERAWARFMKSWLAAARSGLATLPWIVNMTNAGLDESGIREIEPYFSTVLCEEGMEVPEGIESEKVRYFRAAETDGGLLDSLVMQTAGGNEPMPVSYDVVSNERGEETYRLTVQEKSTPVLFKRAFYRGWKVTLDGGKVPVFRVSPGLQMVVIPEGTHTLSWRYSGPNNGTLAQGLFLSGIVIAVFLFRRERRKSRNIEGEENSKKGQGVRRSLLRDNLFYLPSLIGVVFIGIMAWQVISEAYLGHPVIISPREDSVIAGDTVKFIWNFVVGVPREEQQFDIEIARDREFGNILVKEKAPGDSFSFLRPPGIAGELYYRLKLATGEDSARWSQPIRIVLKEGS
ncbi:MAG: hypothetical protein NT072_10760 [Deltaproteobacteria bacterium]|nr:hypothetical protein [Deltaproteobacteria bacterium]